MFRAICRGLLGAASRTGLATGVAFVICSSAAVAQNLAPYSASSSPQSGTVENFVALISNLVMPNLPGAFLLLMLSIFFSTINFYVEVPVNQRSIRGAGRFLFLWISVNYLFALVILLLMLPGDVGLSAFSKTLFVYCVLATAIPEVAANLKLQIGESRNSIDLYKYKTRVSGLISSRVASSMAQYRSLQLIALSYHYFGRLDEFLDRLSVLRNQEGLTDDEREKLKNLAESLRSHPISGESGRVMQLESQYSDVAQKLLSFFAQDIATFNRSPCSHLMKKLQPHLTIDEARRLVDAGVTSAGVFLLSCRSRQYRKSISASSGIPANRIEEIYNNTRFVRRQRSFFFVRQLSIMVLIAALVIALFVRHESRVLSQTLIPEQSFGRVTGGRYVSRPAAGPSGDSLAETHAVPGVPVMISPDESNSP